MTLPDGHTRFGIGGEGTTLGPREFSLPPAAVDALFSQIKTVLANPAPVAPLVRARIKTFAGDIADTETGEWVLHVCCGGVAPMGPLTPDEIAILYAELNQPQPAMLRVAVEDTKPRFEKVTVPKPERRSRRTWLWAAVLATSLAGVGYALYNLL